MSLNENMAVHEVLRELVGRCCTSQSEIGKPLADRLRVGAKRAVKVDEACHVEFGNGHKLFLQYKKPIADDDPIRQADVYRRQRYDFSLAYKMAEEGTSGGGDVGYYLLKNMGWQGFAPYLELFSELNVLSEEEKGILKDNMARSNQSKTSTGTDRPAEGGNLKEDDSGKQSNTQTSVGKLDGTRSFNRIVFGAPGTGKSYRLNEEAKKSFSEANCERVTFYATYSYAQFVGSYKPVMKKVEGQEKIAYEFVPGPFLRMLVKAMKNPKEQFLLIIEEINRANAAAVFGDMFQLLDRDGEGKSEYAIATSEDVRHYLVKEGLPEDVAKEIRIPANLYLWATMNSADQGVFPLDTAFKRRWSFEYIGIDEGEPQAPALKIVTYDWKTLRKFLNRLLVLNGVNEDKLMGPFFLKDAAEFDSKVLMYLWEDAARMCRRAVFGEIKTYSDLCKSWADKGIVVFNTKTFDDKILQGFEDDLVNA